MSAITTHVLDTARGQPAMGVPVVLERRLGPDEWEGISRGETDSDGRLRSLLPDTASLTPGTYRLIFDTRRYFEHQHLRSFYPQVIIVFEAVAGESHYHVPLLLNAFGYTTYRGS
jgi:5-hydroxyisourate hydrolase